MVDNKPTLKQVVEQVLAEMDGPLTVKDLADRVYAIYPTRSKTALSSLRNCLHYDEQGVNLVYLNKSTILPTRIAMQGIRFRVPIDRYAEKENTIPPSFFNYFIHRETKLQNVRFMDDRGNPIDFRVKTVKNIWEPNSLGRRDFVDAFEFGNWFNQVKPQRGDSLLVTVQDWESHTFLIEYEPKRERNLDAIQRYNKEFSDILFNLLEESLDGHLFVPQVIPDVFVRLSDPRGYPGDNWREIIERDQRVRNDGISLFYAEDLPSFELMELAEAEQLPWIHDSYRPAQENDVYRFKANLGYNPSIWRTIEIKAGQTFSEFDGILRKSFNHDMSDHMSGFSKLIPRGKSKKKFREVEIGDVDPFGEGTAAELRVGGLGLKPGDTLQYVYDFGDWVEHQIILESIGTVEEGKSYPRIVEQNKPRYKYCADCQRKGKQTVATWICIECSQEKQKDILVCETCLDENHEEHWAEEVT
ncbi:MAG TPA: hypothetical protein VK206_03820, partial [Anaerolineales bacterium]|nr:hypothetical protein [Anaerolineales bacterium]